MAITPNSVLVKVTKKTVAFPPVCPHCLKPATASVGIQSDERLAGYYVVYTRWEYSTIRVPFCASFAKRIKRTQIICFSAAFISIAAYILSIFATGRAVQGNEASFVFIIFIGVLWLPSMLFRPGKYIKLLDHADGIRFEVRDLRYAKMLASLNGEIPSENGDDGI